MKPRPTPTPSPTWIPPTATSTPTEIPPTATSTPTEIPPTETPTPTPTPEPALVTTTIDYIYDPLERLISADYTPAGAGSPGEFFHYTYDAVGNRLTQETQEGLNAYLYDAADRLVELDGAALEWDVNGNLLRDQAGAEYSYDHQNRLVSVEMGGSTYSFAYNGLGDRVQQGVDGVSSTYALDLNAWLTQVLSDGTNAYLYGLSRIAEDQPSGWAYHLPDALGSVRQLVNESGAAILAKAYQPFGSPLSTGGFATTSYGFTGEWTDATELVHLRARYYQPEVGRFFQVDPFSGLAVVPGTLHSYSYALNNPLLYADPSGRLIGVISAAALGGIIGFLGGGLFASIIYRWASHGECGCEMQMWALSIDADRWVFNTALISGAIGIIAGGIAASAPIGAILIGLAGVGYAGQDLYHLVGEIYSRWQATAELSFTKCELLRFVLDVVGIVGGALLTYKGVSAMLESGSPLRWPTPGTDPPEALGTTNRKVNFPDEGQLNKVFNSHGEDFGLSGNWNPSKGEQLARIITDHVHDPTVRRIPGTYRGGQPAVHYLNEQTWLDVFTHPNGDLWSGWILEEWQFQRLITTGGF